MKIKLEVVCDLKEQPVVTADLRKRGYGGIILSNNQRETIFCLRLENGGIVDISFDDDDIRQLAKQAAERVSEIDANKPVTKWENES